MTRKKRVAKPQEEETYALVPLSEIFFDSDFNARGDFNQIQVSTLADQIEELGLIHPIVLQPYDKEPGKKYRIVCGHMRFRAHKLLKWPTIKSLIRHGLTDEDAMLINYWENLERNDFTLLEEAKAIKKMYPDALNGMSLRALSAKLKRDTRWVHRRLRLLDLPDEVQEFANTGRLSDNKLDFIIKLTWPDEQIKAVRAYAAAKEEQEDTGRLGIVPKQYQPKNYKKRPKTDTIVRMMAKMLSVGITGLGPKMGAWFLGEIGDKDLIEAIESTVFLKDEIEELKNRVRILEHGAGSLGYIADGK